METLFNKDELYVFANNFVIGFKMSISAGLDYTDYEYNLYLKCQKFCKQHKNE